MPHREQIRVIGVFALVYACFELTISLTTAQGPSRHLLTQTAPSPANQQKGDQKNSDTRSQGAQAERRSQGGAEESIKIPTEMVQLDVKVTDQNGRPVSGLTKDDFVVYEDKISQRIESVSNKEAPMSMGLVIDTSGSMSPKLYTVSEAARRLIRQMRHDDEAFLVQFKAEAELLQEFTSDQRELEDALGTMYASGGTALLDAIIATADHAQDSGRQRRKALVVITDGLDKNSSAKEKRVMEVMKEDEVQVYLIGFVDEEGSGWFFGASPARKAKELLIRLAEDSGGRAFFPKDLSETSAIAAQIAKDLRTQYVVSYYPNNDRRDGVFHTVRVAVNRGGNRKLIAHTRQGYYARNDKLAPQGAGERRPQ